MEKASRAFAQKWLQKAEHDFQHAQHSLKLEDYDWTQLACQQAAEKALKAVCIVLEEGLIRTHELAALARKVGAPKKIIEQCALLNSLYTTSRYPDAEEDVGEEYAKEAAQDAIVAAQEVIAWCKEKI